jgi:ParB/RepB/Spo0J family partition protein
MSKSFTQHLTEHSARVLARHTEQGEPDVTENIEQEVEDMHVLADAMAAQFNATVETEKNVDEVLDDGPEGLRELLSLNNIGKEERPVKPAPKPGKKTQMTGEVKVKRTGRNANSGNTSNHATKPKAEKVVKSKAEKKVEPATDLSGLVSGDKNGLKDVKLVSLSEIEQLPAGDPPTRGFIESVRLHGVVEPIKVRRTGSPNTPYAVIDGRRRVTAASLAGLKSVRALVEHRSDVDEDVVALISNDQRSDNLIDQHRHVSNLLAKGKTVKQIMLSCGMSEYEVTRARDLGKLRPELIDAVDKGQMPPAVARHAAMLSDEDQGMLIEILKSEGRIKARDVSAVRRKNQHAAVANAAAGIPDLDDEEAEREGRYTEESEKRLTRAQKRSRAADLAKKALDLLSSMSSLDDEETQAKMLLEEAIKRF